MSLELLIEKLKEVSSYTKEQKKNVETNIAICKMQIKIRSKLSKSLN